MSQTAPPVRIAIAGAGVIGRRHIESMLGDPAFDLVAAADPSPASAAYLEQKGVTHFADLSEMLDTARPAGVVVATPNALHEPMAIACLESGIPVLIEKPVAHTVASAMRIAAAARKSGVGALVGHHRRHNPLMRAARDFIASGALGTLITVAAYDMRRKADTYYEAAWRCAPGGGPILINGIHDIDCLRFLCGDIDSVVAMTANRARGHAVEDTAAVTMRFRNGVIGNLTLSDAVQAPWAWEIASGEEAEYPYQHQDCYLIGGTTGSLAVPTLDHWRNTRGGGRGDPFIRTQLYYKPADPWLEELRHFAQMIRGEVAPLVTVEDGARTLATTLAISRSAESGQAVTIDSMYD